MIHTPIQRGATNRKLIRTQSEEELIDKLSEINKFLDRIYEETLDSSFLAVKVNFLLDLRVGELVALRNDDLLYNEGQLY